MNNSKYTLQLLSFETVIPNYDDCYWPIPLSWNVKHRILSNCLQNRDPMIPALIVNLISFYVFSSEINTDQAMNKLVFGICNHKQRIPCGLAIKTHHGICEMCLKDHILTFNQCKTIYRILQNHKGCIDCVSEIQYCRVCHDGKNKWACRHGIKRCQICKHAYLNKDVHIRFRYTFSYVCRWCSEWKSRLENF